MEGLTLPPPQASPQPNCPARAATSGHSWDLYPLPPDRWPPPTLSTCSNSACSSPDLAARHIFPKRSLLLSHTGLHSTIYCGEAGTSIIPIYKPRNWDALVRPESSRLWTGETGKGMRAVSWPVFPKTVNPVSSVSSGHSGHMVGPEEHLFWYQADPLVSDLQLTFCLAEHAVWTTNPSVCTHLKAKQQKCKILGALALNHCYLPFTNSKKI